MKTLDNDIQNYIETFHNPDFTPFDFLILLSVLLNKIEIRCFNRNEMEKFIIICKKSNRYEKLLSEFKSSNNGIFDYCEEFQEALSQVMYCGILYTISPSANPLVYVDDDFFTFELNPEKSDYISEMQGFIFNFLSGVPQLPETSKKRVYFKEPHNVL